MAAGYDGVRLSLNGEQPRCVHHAPASGTHRPWLSGRGRRRSWQEYRAKRDFAETRRAGGRAHGRAPGRPLRRPAPSGPPAALRLPARGRRRARQLGGPEGADARPGGRRLARPRRGPPARVLRLRGRHPARASTAAATSSSGTGAPGSRATPTTRPRRSPPASCTSTCTARSCAGRFVLIRRGERPSRQGAVAAAPQARRARRRRLGRRGPPAVGASAAGPTTRSRPTRTRCGAATSGRQAEVARRRGRRRHRPTTSSRRSTRSAEGGTWTFAGHDAARSPTSTRCCSPARDGERAGHQARPDPLLRDDRAVDAAVPRRSAGQPAPLPERRRPARASGTRRCRRTRPSGSRAGATTTPTPGETEWYIVADSPPTLAWLANYGAVELHPWTSQVAERAPADVGADRHRSRRRRRRGTRCSTSPGSTAPRSSTSASRACPKVTGQRGIQIWVPVEPGLHLRRHAGVGRALSRAVGETVPELVSWEWEKDATRRARPARLHAERDQQDAGRAVQRAARRRARRCRCRSTWDELDDPELRTDRWTIRDVLERLREAATRWPR